MLLNIRAFTYGMPSDQNTLLNILYLNFYILRFTSNVTSSYSLPSFLPIRVSCSLCIMGLCTWFRYNIHCIRNVEFEYNLSVFKVHTVVCGAIFLEFSYWILEQQLWFLICHVIFYLFVCLFKLRYNSHTMKLIF